MILPWTIFLVTSVLYFINKAEDRYAKKMVEEWVVMFPGKCMICSMDRYGKSHFGIDKNTAHDCIEDKR